LCTNTVKIEHFLGVLIRVGLVKFPRISDCWSRNPTYSNKNNVQEYNLINFLSFSQFGLMLFKLCTDDGCMY